MCQPALVQPMPLHVGHVRFLKLAGAVRRAGRGLKADALRAEWESVEAVRQTVEEPIAAAVRRVFEAQLERVLERLPDVVGLLGLKAAEMDPLVAETLLESYVWDRLLDDEARPLFEEVLRKGFATGALRVSYSSPTLYAPTAHARSVLEEVLARTKGTTLTTQQRLGRIIMEGVEAGRGVDEIAAQISAEFAEWGQSRAHLIAQTAATPLFEAAQQEAFREAGITLHRWLSQRDNHVRDAHLLADGQEVEVGKPFEVGGELLLYPGDTSQGASGWNVVGCRCTTLPIIPEGGAGTKAVTPAGKLIDVAGMNEQEVLRIEQAVEQSVRDRKIREAHAGGMKSLSRLAERFHCSESTARRAIWGA